MVCERVIIGLGRRGLFTGSILSVMNSVKIRQRSEKSCGEQGRLSLAHVRGGSNARKQTPTKTPQLGILLRNLPCLRKTFRASRPVSPGSAILDGSAGIAVAILTDRLPRRQTLTGAQRLQRREQLGGNEREGLHEGHALEHRLQRRRRLGLDVLADEAAELLRVGQGGGVEGAAGDVADVDAAEGVDAVGVAADGAGLRVREALGRHGFEDVRHGPGVFDGAPVPVVRDALVAVPVAQRAVGGAGVGEEGLQHARGEQAAREGGGAVRHEFEHEQVRGGREGDAGEGGGEVVRVVGDGVELAVVLVRGEDGRGDVAVAHGDGEVEEFLEEDGVGGAVGVHGRGEEVAAGDGGVAFAFEVAVRADPSFLAHKALERSEGAGGVGMISDRPSLRGWVPVEERRCLLQDLGGGLV